MNDIIIDFTDEPFALSSIEDFIILEEDDVGYIFDDNIEKSVISALGNVYDYFKGFFGRWVTFNGRAVFIKVKNRLFSSDIAQKEARMAADAFKKLPAIARHNLQRIQLKERNILELILPDNTTARLLGKDFIGKKGYRVSIFNSSVQATVMKRPTLTKPIEVRDPLSGKLVSQEHDKSMRSASTQKVFNQKNTLTIIPGRLRTLEGFARSKTTLLSSGKRIKRPALDVADYVYRGGGYAMFPHISNASSALRIFMDRFADLTKKEGAVTRAAEKARLAITGPHKGGVLDNIISSEMAASRVNFADLYMIYQRRASKYKTTWNNLQKSHPETLNLFERMLGLLDAK